MSQVLYSTETSCLCRRHVALPFGMRSALNFTTAEALNHTDRDDITTTMLLRFAHFLRY